MNPSRSTRWLNARWRAGGTEWMQLKGWSMAPALRDGDWLKVEPVGATLAAGQIVAYLRGDRLVAHRLIDVTGAKAWTRGDALATADAPIAIGELLGRVVGVRRSSPLVRLWRRLRRAS